MTIFGSVQPNRYVQTLLATAGANKEISGNLRICNNGFSPDYFLTNLTESSKRSDFSITHNPVGSFLGDNGTKYFILDIFNTTLYMYELERPYDIESKKYTATATLDLSSQTPKPYELWMDETHIFVACDYATPSIKSWDMATNWDITTATFNSSFDVSGQEGNPRGVHVNSDGSKLWLVGNANDTIYQYTLGTAFTPSSMVYDNKSYTLGGSNVYCLRFSSDGKVVYYYDLSNYTIHAEFLAVAWDISTVAERSVDGAYSQSLVLTANTKSFIISEEANKLILVTATGGGYVYDYAAPETICKVYKQASGSSLPASKSEQDLNVTVASDDTFVDAASRVLTDGERLVVESNTGSAIFSFEGVEENV